MPAVLAGTTASRLCCQTAPRWRRRLSRVGAGATTAPLNPAYRGEEFRFYLEDLGAKALFVEAGSESPAIEVARDLGVTVYELDVPDGAPAGGFEISGVAETAGNDIQTGFAAPDDVALVLHTSGTTSRPKIVPLSQTNICASARNIGQTLSLSAEDRCVNIMPLFHIHGPDRGCPLEPGSRREHLLHTGIRCVTGVSLVRRRRPQLVHGGPDHASGDPVAGITQSGNRGFDEAAFLSARLPRPCRRR